MPILVDAAAAEQAPSTSSRAVDQLMARGRMVQEGSLLTLLVMLPVSKAVIEVTFFLLLIGWMLEHAPTRWCRSVWRAEAQPVGWAVIGYLAACAFSILISHFMALSLNGFIRKTLEYALFFIIAADAIRLPKARAWWLPALALAGAVVAIDANWQLLLGKDPLLGHSLSRYHRMSGPYDNPIDMGTYLMVTIPILAAWWCEAPRWHRVALGGLLLYMARCVILAEAQGPWIGLAIAMAAFAVLSSRYRTPLLIAGALLLSCGLVMLAAMGRLPQAMTIQDVGFRDRLYMWRAAWGMIQDSPWVGHGLNTFMANYMTYWVGGEMMPRYAHNCYLQMWAETGLVGLLAFLGWAAGVLWLGITAIVTRARTWDATILAGAIAGFVAMLAHSGLDTDLYAMRQVTLCWLLAGCIVGLAVDRLRGTAQPPPG